MEICLDKSLQPETKLLEELVQVLKKTEELTTISYSLLNSSFSINELTSYVFGAVPHSIYMYTNIPPGCKIRLASLPFLFEGIIGSVFVHEINTLMIVSPRAGPIDKVTTVTKKFLYSYCIAFFNRFPDVIVLKSEIPMHEESLMFFNSDFYYEKLLAGGADIQLHNNELRGKILYTNDSEVVQKYNDLVDKYGYIIPINVLTFHFAGFYFQTTGWTITYQDDKWLGIKPPSKFSHKREYIIDREANTLIKYVKPETSLHIEDILEDAINTCLNRNLIFRCKVKYENKSSIFALARACYEKGIFNLDIKRVGGFLEANFFLFDYNNTVEALENISKYAEKYKIFKFQIVPLSSFYTLFNTDDMFEVLYCLTLLFAERFAVYKNGDDFSIIYASPLKELDILKSKLNKLVFSEITLNTDDNEPITCENLSSMSPRRKSLLVKFGNPQRYYILSSLIGLLDYAETRHSTLARNPINRQLIPLSEKVEIYDLCAEKLLLKNSLKKNRYDTRIKVEQDESWICIYLEWKSEQYPIALFPILNTQDIQVPLQALVDLTIKFHDLQILLHPHFKLEYAINKLLYFDDPLEIYTTLGSKKVWIENNPAEVYNMVCSELKAYL